MASPLQKALDQMESESQLEAIRRRARGTRQPSFGGSVVHGLTLGYAGTKPQNWVDTAGEMLGSFLPILAATALTGPVAGTLAGALSLGPEAIMARTALRYGLAGALTGGARSAETPGERMENLAVEGTLGAIVPAVGQKLLSKFRPKSSGLFTPPNIVENLPEGHVGGPETIPGVMGAPSKTVMSSYPTGAFSRIPLYDQLNLPLTSVGDVRAEAQAAQELGKGVEFIHRANPKKTLDWLEREAFERKLWVEHDPKASLKYSIFPIDKMSRTASPTASFRTIDEAFSYLEKQSPLVKGPAPYQVRSATGELRSFQDLKEAQSYIRSLSSDSAAGQQLGLPFGNAGVDTELQSAAKKKGFDIISNPSGYSAVGRGGRVESFKTPEELKGFLNLQKDAPVMPALEYGTFEKAVNGVAFGAEDRTVNAMQKMISNVPSVTLGHGIAEAAKIPTGGKMNAFVGLPQDQVVAAQQKAAEAGYKFKTFQVADGTYDVLYTEKMDRRTLNAVRNWLTLRQQGPRGLIRPFPQLVELGSNFGLNVSQQARWAFDTSMAAAQDVRPHLVGVLGQMASPQQSRSPLISAISNRVLNTEIAKQLELSEAFRLKRALIDPLSDADRNLASRIIEGETAFSEGSQKVQEAVTFYRGLMQDFAKRRGLPVWTKYMTHVTDYDALWNTTREAILSKDKDLLGKLKDVPGGYDRLVKYANSYTDKWTSIPREIRDDIKKLAFKWDVLEWDKLPRYLRDKLPSEIFNPYVLKRTGEIPYLKDVGKAFDHYVPRMLHDLHYSPLLKEVGPTINAMSGGNVGFTEKRYLEKYLSNVVTGRPDAYTNMFRHVMDSTNETLGTAFADPNWMNDMITLWRDGMYRGAIGVDTAFINVTQGINNIAENGKFVGPLFKLIMSGRRAAPNLPGVVGEFINTTELIPRASSGKTMDYALDVSKKINNIVLSPMGISEWINRGLAWHAGMEEAAQMGLSLKDALKMSAAKASEILPNLQLTEAQYHAMMNVMRTQFGYTAAQLPPLFSNPLGRLSTLFLSYPIRQAEFLANGIAEAMSGYGAVAKAAGESFATQSVDKMKLLRYMALTGFTMSAPYLMARVGVDVSRVWGKGVLPSSLPFAQMLMNGYNSIVGDDPYSLDKARRALTDSVMTSIVPQFRWGKGASEAINRVERGFATDSMGKYIHDASGFGEIMKLAGFPPQSYINKRKIAEELTKLGQDYKFERENAIRDLLETGNQEAVSKFTLKWGKPITPEDVMKVAQWQQTTPERRASTAIPDQALMSVLQQRPWLAGGQ